MISTLNARWVWLIAGVFGAGLIVFLIYKIVEGRRKKRETALGTDEGMAGSAESRKKRRRWWIPVWIILTILLAVGIVAACVLLPGAKACNLFRRYSKKESLHMALTVDAELGGKPLSVQADVDRLTEDGRRITVVSQNGCTLYYCEGVVFLENGTAYTVSAAMPDSSGFLGTAAEIFSHLDVSENDGVYTAAAEGEDAQEILRLLLPSAAEQLPKADRLKVVLETNDHEISVIRFSGSGSLTDGSRTPYAVSAEMCISDGSTASVPAPVQEAISRGDRGSGGTLTEDLLSLLSAWQMLNAQASYSADLTLWADCGPIMLDERMTLCRWNIGDKPITSLQANGFALYFTDSAVCDRDGTAISMTEAEAVDSAKLLEIACEACLYMEYTREDTDSGTVYTVALNEDGMEAVLHAIVPAAESLNIRFSGGSIRITLADRQIDAVEFACSGTVNVVLTTAAVSFGAELTFQEGAADTEFPDAVKDTLLGK